MSQWDPKALARWTHAICESCWIERDEHRVPTRVKDAPLERCCFCGSLTQGGIYVRHDPDTIENHEAHNDE